MWFYLALLSAFFNALGNVARRTHGSLAEPADLLWWTLLISLPLGFGLMLISKGPYTSGSAWIIPTVVSATINCYANVLHIRAYKYGDASAISPIANLLPLLLIPTSYLMLGTVPHIGGLIGILFVVGGVYYSSVNGRHDLLHPLRQIFKDRGSRAMLGVIALWSVSTNLQKISLSDASPTFLIFMAQLIMFALVSGYLLFQPRKQRLKHGEKVVKRWGWHLAAIAVFVTLGAVFQMEAINLASTSTVLAVKRLDVLFTVLLAGLFLHEKHILKRFEGSVVALIGVVIIFVSR